ncbi:MAG TPA: SPFH domain-containing protein [Prolixibacteraceae bacterium]|nr:SPFH domain-containing protein [Prolixibacteraceae bacterium]
MFLILVGIVVIVVGFVLAKTESPVMAYSGTIRIAGFLILLLGLAVASVKQIEPGVVGVQKLFGKVNSNILESGLNVVNPLVEVVTFDVRTQNYTMTGVHDEGDKSGDDAIRVLSADGLEVVIDLTVLYKVIGNEAPRILKEIGTDYRNVIVRPICHQNKGQCRLLRCSGVVLNQKGRISGQNI